MRFKKTIVYFFFIFFLFHKQILKRQNNRENSFNIPSEVLAKSEVYAKNEYSHFSLISYVGDNIEIMILFLRY